MMGVDMTSPKACPKCGCEETYLITRRREIEEVDVIKIGWHCSSCNHEWGIELSAKVKREEPEDYEKYAQKWMKVQDVITEAQKKIENIVKEICELVKQDLEPTLQALSRYLKFTYVIEPKLGNGDILSCTPTLIIDAPHEVYQIVQKVLMQLYPETCSMSRLTIERKPPTIPL